MKKILILLLCISVFTNCKKEAKQEIPNTIKKNGIYYPITEKQNDGLTLLAGEFFYYADAAVLQIGNSSIYGVIINEKMHELHKMGKPFRKDATDAVMVQVRGKIVPKTEGEEGWPYNFDIKEIISVKPLENKSEVIKIEK